MYRPNVLLLTALLAVAACSQKPETSATPPGCTPCPPTVRTPPVLPDSDPRTLRFHRVDMLISQWDAAQAGGRIEQSEALSAQVRAEVDGAFCEFATAARGERGLELQFLGVSSMGFSQRPDSTQILLQRLTEGDSRLIGNALIALKLRADPATPLGPILRHVANPAREPRRYAPLAVANVMEARHRTGRPTDPQMRRAATHVLSGVVADRDPLVRLHAAKALGALRAPGCYDLLMIMVKDAQFRVRLAAGVGLERLGDPRGFPALITILSDAPHDARPLVRDLLASFASRLQGRPLSGSEISGLGVSPSAWQGWFNQYRSRSPVPIDEGVGSRRHGGAAPGSRSAPLPQPAPFPRPAPGPMPPPQVR